MQLSSPIMTERFGAVRLHDIQRVLELDSGNDTFKMSKPRGVQMAANGQIWDIESKMAIIVPIKDDKINLFQGVLSGIPHNCQIIVVSNSKRVPTDRYLMEVDTVNQFRQLSDRKIITVHQKDESIARAFKKAGYKDILDDAGLVRNGKAEGMVIGIVLAKLLKKKYVGFADSDNYMPGAVWEYIKDFSAGFANSNSPYTMVRLVWKYKPKFAKGRTYFKKSGRISEYSNIYMNQLISDHIGFETNIVRSTCAGEHAMTMDLAEIIPLSTGFTIETQELLSLFEGYGGILPMANKDPIKKGIDIYQIETANPHMHEERGGDHVGEVLLDSLSALYHSKICGETLKKEIRKELFNHGIIKKRQTIEKPKIIPPIATMDFKKFKKEIDLKQYYVN